MSLPTWQATVQDKAGNAVVNPSITVRNASDNSLATIFDADGLEKSNPFIGSTEGFAQFFARTGNYIVQGASGGSETDVWRVNLTANADYVTPQMFGARANMTYSEGPNGPLRTGGDNDRSAFIAADAYAFARGVKVIVPNGQYYIDGQFNPRAKWHAENDFKPIIWTRYGRFEIGVNIVHSGVEWVGFRMIGQYDNGGTSKGPGKGHIGNIVVVGTYLTLDEQEPVTDWRVRVLARRARMALADGQRSNGSSYFNGMGYIVNGKWEIGFWGAGSNTNNTTIIQHHWGGVLEDDPGNPWDISKDPTEYTRLEAYHCENITVEFLNDVLDCGAHGVNIGWVRSATIGVHMGACTTTGAQQGTNDVPGDEIDTLSNEAQRRRVGLNNTMGLQQHLNVAVASGVAQAINVVSRGTSKSDDDPGGGGLIQAQVRHQVKGEGLVVTTVSGPRIVRYFTGDIYGEYDPGPMWLTANHAETELALYHQASRSGNLNIQRANRPVRIRQGWCRDMFLRTDMGEMERVDNQTGTFRLGWRAANYGLSVETTRSAATLLEDLSPGDDIAHISIDETEDDGLPRAVPRGVLVKIGDGYVMTREFSQRDSTILRIEPAQFGATAGADVDIILRAGVEKLRSEIRSSEHGIQCLGAFINDLDMTHMTGQGRNALWLKTHDNEDLPTSIGSLVHIRGGRMPMIGRVKGQYGPSDSITTGNSPATIRVQPRCAVMLTGVDIPANPYVDYHLRLIRGAGGEETGPWGRAILSGCRIEDPLTLALATDLSQSVSLHGCVDYTGRPVTIDDLTA